MKTIPVITIDGPGGSGKGTISQVLAQRLNWHFLDSGALYRLLALAVQNHQLSVDDEAALEKLALKLDISFKVLPDKSSQIILEGADVTTKIRTEAIGNQASQISRFAKVRQALLERQRVFRQLPGLVADGRDMGTIVFPDAFLKIFLTASAQERAKRRYKQLKGKGINVTLAGLLIEIEQRDKRDQERSVAPLIPAVDAIVIDTTELNVEQVTQRIWQEVERRLEINLC